MLRAVARSFLLLSTLVSTTYGDDVNSRFLIPGKLIFHVDFEDGENPGKPNWQLRKSSWEVENGVLRGVNIDGNGPFIRLHSIENGGVLPENYIMKFSFMTTTLPNPPAKEQRKIHPTLSVGHRFSFGHYAAKYQWRTDIGMDLAIGHGLAIADSRFHIKKDKWYHVTAEIRGAEILVWFKDGPAYYMQHDHFRSKPSGWEFFTHITEAGHLDNLQVWSLAGGTRPKWAEVKAKTITAKRAFLSSEYPNFDITKDK